MQQPHPSFGRCLSLSCLAVADAVARGCRAVVVAEVAAFMVEASASRVLHHAPLHKGKALFVLVPNLLFSCGHPSTSVTVCRTDPHRHPSLPFSESGGRRFSCPAFLAHTFYLW